MSGVYFQEIGLTSDKVARKKIMEWQEQLQSKQYML